uniref:Putative secreted protein n=1 Tax=Anopheles marajoara TaxID=58244 RepID=A0A2M4CC10_9DIPT
MEGNIYIIVPLSLWLLINSNPTAKTSGTATNNCFLGLILTKRSKAYFRLFNKRPKKPFAGRCRIACIPQKKIGRRRLL